MHPPPAEMSRCLKTVRRLLHPPPAEMCAMLKNGTTLIQFPPRQEMCDAYFRRRQFSIDECHFVRFFQNFVNVWRARSRLYQKSLPALRVQIIIIIITDPPG